MMLDVIRSINARPNLEFATASTLGHVARRAKLSGDILAALKLDTYSIIGIAEKVGCHPSVAREVVTRLLSAGEIFQIGRKSGGIAGIVLKYKAK